MSRARESYLPVAKQAIQPPPDDMPNEPGVHLKVFPCICRIGSAAQKNGLIHVVETDDRNGLPSAQAFMEMRGIAKPLSVSIDATRARDMAKRILAGERELIRDFRTTNALAVAVLWLTRNDWDWSVLRFRDEAPPSDSDQVKLTMQEQRYLAKLVL